MFVSPMFMILSCLTDGVNFFGTGNLSPVGKRRALRKARGDIPECARGLFADSRYGPLNSPSNSVKFSSGYA